MRLKNRYIDEYIRFINSKFEDLEPKYVTYKQFRAYADSLRTTNKNSTVKAKIDVIKTWYEWLYAENKITNNPISDIDIF